MKRNILPIFLYSITASLVIGGVSVYAMDNLPAKEIISTSFVDQNYVPNQLLVKFKKQSGLLKSSALKMQQSVMSNASIQQVESINNNAISVVQIQDGKSVTDKVTELMANPNVEYVEPNYFYYTQSFNDTSSGALWGLSQISGYQAFDLFSGNANQSITGTIVAVIDAGVAYDHPDLLHQMRDGSGCKDENGNALGSCLHGYDFADNDKNPYPVRSAHGTHVAGIIAAEANNATGVIGINFNAKIMAIRAGDDSLTVSDIIKGIDFARQNGAKIINASFGGTNYSTGLYDAINTFKTTGGLFISAAGNSTYNHTTTPIYPCDYTLDNIICVAATDANDNLASFSDYGSTSVDVAAPGTSIYSTLVDVVETTGLFETLESTSIGSIPSGWTTGGSTNTWGVKNIGSSWGHVLYGDTTYPYASNTNTTIQKTISTANASGISVDFWTICDTQYSTSSWNDYMALEISGSNNFSEIDRRDEADLDTDSIEANNTNGLTYAHLFYDLTGTLSTANAITLRFRRVSDSTDNNYPGCVIDDMRVKTYTSNTSSESYVYMNGTSMATPYVAGLASLARSMRPDLGYQTIKSVILGSGDSLSSLTGKTVSGKRINAYNTLMALNPVPTLSQVHITSSNSHSGYAKNGDIITLSFTGNINLSGVSVRINGYTGQVAGSNTYWTATVNASGSMANTGVSFEIMYQNTLGRAGLTQTGTTDGSKVIVDTTNPSLTILTASGSVTGNTIQIQGTGSDLNGIYQILISGAVLSGNTNRSQTVALQPGLNSFTITGIDYAGNYVVKNVDLTRIPDIFDPTKAGTNIFTGYISLSGATATGITFINTGVVQINTDTINNYLQIL